GSRPTGWWRDRAGAARMFVDRVRRAATEGELSAPIVLVLEGQARRGAEESSIDGVDVVHARGLGDDTIAALAEEHGEHALVVSADRALGERVRRHGAQVVGPSWLLDRLPD